MAPDIASFESDALDFLIYLDSPDGTARLPLQSSKLSGIQVFMLCLMMLRYGEQLSSPGGLRAVLLEVPMGLSKIWCAIAHGLIDIPMGIAPLRSALQLIARLVVSVVRTSPRRA